MYDLDGLLSLDEIGIKDWCLKNLSPSNFWLYLNLNDSEREAFEEEIWRNYERNMSGLFADDIGIGDTWPDTELDWDWELNRRTHDGPGLLVVKSLFQGHEEEYGSNPREEKLLLRHRIHYNPAEWSELNDSLVRDLKARKRRPENYDQLLFGVSLV